MKKHICESCNYIYDPEQGDEGTGVPKGTAFEDLPEGWLCPVCNDDVESFVEIGD